MNIQSPVIETLNYQTAQDIILEQFLNLWKEMTPEFRQKNSYSFSIEGEQKIIVLYCDGKRVCSIEEPVGGVINVTWMRSVQDLKNIERVVIKMEKEFGKRKQQQQV